MSNTLKFKTVLSILALITVSCFAFPMVNSSQAAPGQSTQDQEIWQDLKDDLYENRAIKTKANWLTMQAPYRAHDAALVPITIHAEPQKTGQYFKALTLIVDKNPVPVAAVFELSPKLGTLHIETRIRIDQYSNVRAIIETNDGQLYMVSKFVKAAGGCSAPAMKDMDAKMAMLGRSKLRQFTPAQKVPEGQSTKLSPELREVQVMVRHPNYSGMQLNQETGYYIPAHYVSEIQVSVDGEQLMKVAGAISLSEDPVIRFRFASKSKQPMLNLIVRDTKKNEFKNNWQLKAQTSQQGS